MATLNENIARVKSDFGGIKRELVNKGASIPSGTPTSQYANIIKNMSTGDAQEAYEQGRQDVIAESKYIPKTVTGKVISLTDVSEVAHKVKVYGDGQEVEVYGKNLYDNSRLMTKMDDGTPASRIQSGYLIPVAHNTNYVISATNVTTQPFYSIKGFTKENYIATPSWNDLWSLGDIIKNNHQGSFDTGDYDYISFRTWAENSSYGVTEDTLFQLELGTPTPYEPYTKQTITATPTGTEIDSMCPNMNFIADSDITVDYYSSFGMNEERRRVFNTFQQGGQRQNYSYACFGDNFSDDTFYPIFDFHPTNIMQMFYNSRVTDLLGTFERQKVVFDTSNCITANHAFCNCQTKRLPIIDLSKASTNSVFYKATNLWYIEKIISSENTVWHNDAFGYLSALVHCPFEGVIASDINLKDCSLLDAKSALSLCGSLKWLEWVSGEDGEDHREKDVTVTLHPNVWKMLEKYDQFGQLIDETPEEEIGIPMIEHIIGDKGWNIA